MASKKSNDRPNIIAEPEEPLKDRLAKRQDAILLSLLLAPPTEDELRIRVAFLQAICEEFDRTLQALLDRNSAEQTASDIALNLLTFLHADIKRGQKTRASAKRGHEAVYGTKAEKVEKAERYKRACLETHEKHPRWGPTAIRAQVAEDFGVAARTIMRHVPDLAELLHKRRKS